jgi:predicted transcriptional regulator
MPPEDCRIRWGLPNDYPMVAPNSTAARSALAKSVGFGKVGRAGAKTRGRAKPAAT